MKIVLKYKPTVSFCITKLILDEIDYDITKESMKEIKYLLYPNMSKVENLSLTAKQDFNHQLRYYMIDRVKGMLNRLAYDIKDQTDSICLLVSDLDNILEGDHYFLNVLSKFVNIKIEITNGNKLDKVENNIFISNSKKDLYTIGLKYLSVGDLWTARDIFEYLVKVDDQVINLFRLGTVYNLLEETEKAEYYFELYRSDKVPEHIVEANYMLAMLYARHHPDYLKDDEKAISLLNEAYSYVKDSICLESIFNRNGYALMLFKSGNVNEAISTLNNCLEQIEFLDNSQSVDLHKSVLVYNLFQCYRYLKDLDNTRREFEKLQIIDSYFIEYYMEYAKFLLENDEDNFLPFILNISNDLQDYPDGLSLLGYYYREIDKELALSFFKKAFYKSDRSFMYWYDVEYLLCETDNYQEAMEFLESFTTEFHRLDADDIVSFYIIMAEVLYNNDLKQKALKSLYEVLTIVPDSPRLKEAIEKIK